jgi:DNA repair exonuclease SbcCD ATPase subunit
VAKQKASKVKEAAPFGVRLFADLHLHEWTEFAEVDEWGQNSRLQLQVETLTNLVCAKCPLFEGEVRPEIAVIAGDLVHKRGVITPAVAKAFREVMAVFGEQFKTVYVIPGNHDYPLKRGKGWMNSLVLAKDIPGNIKVVNEASLVEGRIVLIPWMADKEEFDYWVKFFAPRAREEDTILVSHMAMKGGIAENGWIYEGGYDPKRFQEEYLQVYLGDFHTAQSVTNQVRFIGAPYQMHIGDREDMERGALDVYIPGGGVRPLHGRVLSDHPRFVKLVDPTKKELAENARHFVRVVSSDLKEARKLQTVKGVTVEMAPPPPVKQRLEVASDSAPLEILDRYLETLPVGYRDLGDKELDPELLRAACVEVMEQVGFDALDRRQGFLEILEVEAKNFLSYEKLGPVNLDKQGVILLEGQMEDDEDSESNGAGKSAVIEAVTYALYGETIRGALVGSIQRRVRQGEKMANAKGGMFSRVKCRISGGRILEIVRNRKAPEHPDGLTYTVDGVKMDVADRGVCQADLDRLTGMPYSLFKQVVVFGKEAGDGIATATDAQRKSLLESLCSGGQFDPLYEQAKKNLAEIESFRSELTNQVRPLEQQRDQAFSDLEEAKAKSASFKAEREKEAGELEKKADELDTEAAELSQRRAILIEEEHTTVLPKEPDFTPLKLKLIEAKKDVDGFQAGISNKKARLSMVQQDKDNFQRMGVAADAPCPTCGQIVPGETVESLLGIYDRNMAGLSAEIRAQERVLEDAKKHVAELEAENQQLENVRNSRVKVQARLSELKKEIEYTTNSALEKKARAKENRERAKALKARQANPWLEQVEKHEGRHKEAVEALSEIKDQLAESGEILVYAREVARLFGNQGLRTFQFDALSPAITQSANAALGVLSSGALQVSLTTERRGQSEKVALSVDNLRGAPEYRANSGGQKQKVDLALAWAISGLSGFVCNLMFVDEAFDRLDAKACSRVIELMNERRVKRSTILVTTHGPDFRAYFPRVWTARYANQVSTLEQGE